MSRRRSNPSRPDAALMIAAIALACAALASCASQGSQEASTLPAVPAMKGGAATATPASTVSATATPTPSGTPSPSPTASIAPTQTPPITTTPSPSASVTATPGAPSPVNTTAKPAAVATSASATTTPSATVSATATRLPVVPRPSLRVPVVVRPPVVTSSTSCYGPTNGTRDFVINGTSLRDPATGSTADVWVVNGAGSTAPRGNSRQTLLENTDTRIRITLQGGPGNQAGQPISGTAGIWVTTGAGAAKVCDYSYLGAPLIDGVGLYKDAAALAGNRPATSLPKATGGIVSIFGEGLLDPANNLSNPVTINGARPFTYRKLDIRNIQINLPPLSAIPGVANTSTYAVKVQLVITTPYGTSGPLEVKYTG